MRARQRAAASEGSRAGSPGADICQIKVTLSGLRPPIWRRVLVPADLRLDRLHGVLQIAMGWSNAHLHQFIGRTTCYRDPRFGGGRDTEVRDECKATVGDILPAVRSKAVYEYDFGDSWYHELALEKRLAPEPGVAYPRCTGGRRACPPEDCGGVYGYADLLTVLADPAHEDYETFLEQFDGPFDAEAFDADVVNDQLGRLMRRWQHRGAPRAPRDGKALPLPR